MTAFDRHNKMLTEVDQDGVARLPSTSAPHTLPEYKSSRPMDSHQPLKVIYIGAGVSGIVAAIHFKKIVPSLELVIYEKNDDIGGTWYENR